MSRQGRFLIASPGYYENGWELGGLRVIFGKHGEWVDVHPCRKEDGLRRR